MFIHTSVYVILSVMMAAAAFASSMPISKAAKERHVTELDKEVIDTLQ